MSIRNLDKIFNPQRVAIIGASSNPGTVGYSVLRNMINAGFTGVVYPVNPKRASVQGIQSYPDLASLPRTPDLAVICTPASTVPGLVRECGRAGIRGLVILSAGFKEIGADGRRIVGPSARRSSIGRKGSGSRTSCRSGTCSTWTSAT